jgi:hypothetical protein
VARSQKSGKRRGHLDAPESLAVLVGMLATRCKKDGRKRTLGEHAEIDALIRGASALVEISGSWHPDEFLSGTSYAKLLNQLAKKEGLR